MCLNNCAISARAAEDHEVTADRDARDPQRQRAIDRQHDEQHADQNLVCQRIERSAESADPIEVPREPAVDRVRRARNRHQCDRLFVTRDHQAPRRGYHQQDAPHSDQVGNLSQQGARHLRASPRHCNTRRPNRLDPRSSDDHRATAGRAIDPTANASRTTAAPRRDEPRRPRPHRRTRDYPDTSAAHRNRRPPRCRRREPASVVCAPLSTT